MYGNRDPTLSITFKEVDGLKINIDVYIPHYLIKTKNEDFEVMFYIHGGAMTAMDRTDVPRWLPVVAQQRNALLISTDYRLAPQAKISDSFQDVADAFRWSFTQLEPHLHTTGHLHPLKHISKKAMIFGGSAGGWLCLLLGTIDHSSYIDRLCLGAIYPMTNLSDEHYTRPLEIPGFPQIELDSVQAYIQGSLVAGAIPDFDYTTGAVTGRHRAALYMAQQAEWRQWIIGSDSQKKLEEWDIRLLIKKQKSIFPPTFLLHGMDDITILPSNSKDVESVLVNAGIDHCLYLVSDQSHFFDMIANPDDTAVLDNLGITYMIDWLINCLHQSH